MTLISERAIIMPKVSTLVGVTSQYPSQVLGSTLMADNNLTLPATKSTQLPQAERVVIRNEKEVLLEAPL